MARDFSIGEARAAVSGCRHLREELLRVIRAYQNEKEILVRSAKQLITDNETAQSVSEQLRSGKVTPELTPAEARVIQSACRAFRLRRLAEKAAGLTIQYDRDIAGKETILRRASTSIGRLFSGKAARTAANEAYPFLIEKLSGSFSREIQDLSGRMEEIQSLSAQTMPDDTCACPDEVREFIRAEVRDVTGAYQPPQQAALSVLRAEEILSLNRKAEKAGKTGLDNLAVAVRDAAGRAAAVQTYHLLESTAVETLNQIHGGIRTRLLRDHGYLTVADVFRASPVALSAISRIGAESAKQIQDAAKKIVSGMMKTARISISTDSKSPEISNLLSQIHLYLHTERIIDHYQPLLSSPRKECEQTSGRLAKISNHLGWLLECDESKRALAQDCLTLNQILSSSYPKTVTSFFQEITGQYKPDTEAAWTEFAAVPEEYYRILELVSPGILGNDDPHYGLPEDLAKEIQDQAFYPDGLNITLRRYQEWGVKYILHQERVLLGDEMGLGKTVQAIAAMVSLRNTGSKRFFVVCPASVLFNWCREIEQKSKLRAIRIHGPARNNLLQAWMTGGSVAVTTYETLNTLTFPEDFSIDLLVVDEAHYVKNTDALRTRNVHMLMRKSGRILLMTGTALENKVEDMLTLLSPLRPSLAAQARKFAYMSSAPQFRTMISPVYYRRKREDVLTELPEMTEVWEWCDLLPEERAQYRADVLRRDKTAIRRVSWKNPDPHASAKVRRMLEIVDEAESEGRKILVFSFYLETIAQVQKALESRCMTPITGSVPSDGRLQILDRFETMPAGTVLPLQIQAGGIGMNIQSASVVIICEPQLKPSTEQQAISRVYRLGQTRKVLVYHLLAQNTLDERIHRILQEKQAIFDQFADPSAAAEATRAEELKNTEPTVNDLIQEEIDRINQEESGTPDPSLKSPEGT